MMLRSSKNLERSDVRTQDGDIGTIRSILFDEQNMKVRYLVVDTMKWLPGKKVVIPPDVLKEPVEMSSPLEIGMSRDELLESPSLDENKPVSEEKKRKLPGGLPPKAFFLPTGIEPSVTMAQGLGTYDEEMMGVEKGSISSSLRSTDHVEGYSIHAKDGKFGEIEEFIIDTDEWKIRYIVVDTRKFLPGKKVMISPDWIKRFDWENREVHMDHQKEEIKESPEYDPTRPVNRSYEKVLYDYYGRPYYWDR